VPSRSACFLLVLGALLAPATAGAGALASASLTLRADGLSTLAFPGAGATGTATSPGAASLGAGSAFAGTAIGTISPSLFLGLFDGVEIEILSNAAGSFAGIPLAGSAAFQAKAALRIGSFSFTSFGFAFGKSTFQQGTLILPTAGAPFPFSIQGAPWTSGLLQVAGDTAQGTNMLTANGGGTLTLVTPVVLSSPYQPASWPIVVFGELHLEFVPEPATALLLGWGVACLAWAGRRRARGG
jgi:hypothetical protein